MTTVRMPFGINMLISRVFGDFRSHGQHVHVAHPSSLMTANERHDTLPHGIPVSVAIGRQFSRHVKDDYQAIEDEGAIESSPVVDDGKSLLA